MNDAFAITGRNHLGGEKSPYLLQHKDNPVWWHPWGEEAFARAKRENKPIFLSIGYSTCYWCHVMEKDSFEHQEVADVLNRDFVSIKLDREERPDIDQIYMEVVVGLTGHGGWPMSVFLTPELKPFWGGTFFYRAQFISILQQLHRAWTDDHEKVAGSAAHITQVISERVHGLQISQIDPSVFDTVIAQYTENYDERDGGFGAAPKFPPSQQLSLLLRLARERKNEAILAMVTTTLERMARGGIYDHLGGGFSRYSTDAQWLVPHFEKMLYDNALLVTTYLEAFQATGNELFASVARETLDYVLSRMQSPEGGFYSAEDAGEVGKEGEFYVWSEEELTKLLSVEERALIRRIYGASAGGNFEGNNILRLAANEPWAIKKEPAVEGVHRTLLAAREKRERPHLDDKVLTSWNGLMIGACAKGAQVLGDARYLEAASRAADFLQSKLFKNGELLHRYRDNDARVGGFADDYAFLIDGLITLYEAGFESRYLLWARRLQAIQDERLWEGNGYVYSTAPEAIVKRKEFMDNATPSSNSVALANLVRLHAFWPEEEYRDKIEALIGGVASQAARYPTAFPRLLQGIARWHGKSREIAILEGENDTVSQSLIGVLHSRFLPDVAVAVSRGRSGDSEIGLLQNRGAIEGRTTVYVCEKGVCKLPVQSAEEALQQLGER